MNNEMKIFKHHIFGELRTIEINGDPWFVGLDVANALGYSRPRKAITDHCKINGILKRGIVTSNGTPEVNFLSEPNLYRLIMKSKLPEAEKFEEWVFEQILPSVRKHGAYLTPTKIEEVLSDPDTIIKLATQIKQEREIRERVEAENGLVRETVLLQAPKVEYHDKVLSSSSTHLVNHIAKELGMSARGLNQKLKELKVQYKQSDTWVLYSKYQDKGYTKTKTRTYNGSDGQIKTSMQTVWTEAGRKFIHELIKQSDAA